LLENIAIVALLPVAAVIIIPLAIPMLFIDHYYLMPKAHEKERRNRDEFVREEAGVVCNVHISNSPDELLQKPVICEYIAPEIAWFSVDSLTGLRSFASCGSLEYYPNETMLAAMANSLPELVEYSRLWPDGCIRAYSFYSYDFEESEEGVFSHVSEEFFADSRNDKENGWHWRHSPESRDFHYMVWAPGFFPALLSCQDVAPRDTLNFHVYLLPRENKEYVQMTRESFRKLQENKFLGGKRVYNDYHATVEEQESLNQCLEELSEWISDKSLPESFRYSCCKVYYEVEQAIEKHCTEEVEKLGIFDEILGLYVPGLNSFEEEGQKIRRLREIFQSFDFEYSSPFMLRDFVRYSLSADYSSVSAIDSTHVDRWLKYGYDLDEEYPGLADLEAIQALLTGQAIHPVQTRFIDHRTYFHLFEENTELELPRASWQY
jgi:hypothetical protein